MYKILTWKVVFLVAVLTTYASPYTEPGYPQSVPSKRLRPISINDYEASIGLQRRSSKDFSDLDLQTQSELIYRSAGGGGQLLLANMTLYAPDGLLMIMMERFEGLTSSVDCKGDDGSMSLTFSSQKAFDYTLHEWSYINENDDGQFLLIANHEGCGPDDQRQPYLISKITEDTATLTTLLTAKTAPWSDVAGTYDLDFGQAMPYQRPPRAKERNFWGDIENVGKDVLDAATGSADFSKTVNFPMDIGQQGQRTNIYTDDEGGLTLDCVDCFVSGSFAVTGHISVDHFSLQELTLKGSSQGLQAALKVEATITSSDEPDSLQYTKELFSFPIPDAGIEVEGIFKLGATLSYDVGISSSFSGSATIDVGIQVGIPDSAQVTADIQNPDSSSATNWNGGSVTPLFDVTKESASLELTAFSQPKLGFGIELIEIGNFDVALTVKLPEISVTLSAAYDEDGVCGPGSLKTGIKLDSEVDIKVDLEIDASLGDSNDTAGHSWSHTLYEHPIPLDSLCFPLDIPGLDSSSSTTSVFSYSASVSPSIRLSTATPTSALTDVSGSGAVTAILDTQTEQSTGNGSASFSLPLGPDDDVGLGPSYTEVTVVPFAPVIPSKTGSRTGARTASVPDFGVPYTKAKANDPYQPTSSTASFNSDVSLPGSQDDDNDPDEISPMIIPYASLTSLSASTSFTSVTLYNGDQNVKVAPFHTPSSPSASSDTFLLPGLIGDDDIFAAIATGTTTVSPTSISLYSSVSLITALYSAGGKKVAVAHHKTTATPTFRRVSPPSPKPTVTKSPDTAVEKNLDDVPPKPKMNSPPPYSKHTSTSAPLPHKDASAGKNVNDFPPKSNVIPPSPPPPPPATIKKPLQVLTRTNSKPVLTATSTASASGGGGCRIVKRSGKRMLIC